MRLKRCNLNQKASEIKIKLSTSFMEIPGPTAFHVVYGDPAHPERFLVLTAPLERFPGTPATLSLSGPAVTL